MKKILVSLLAAMMLFSFVACDDSLNDGSGIPDDAIYVESVEGLADALNGQQDGTFIVLRAGTYDVSEIETAVEAGNYSNFFIPVVKDNVTIMAEPGADVSISVGESADPVGNWDTQSIVVVIGDNAKISGIDFSVRNTEGYAGKTIEVVGSGCTVEDCTFASGVNSGILVDSVKYIADVAAEAVSGVTVKDCVFESGSWLDLAGEVNGDIIFDRNTFEDGASMGLHGYINGSWNGKIDLSSLSASGNVFKAGSCIYVHAQDDKGTGITGFSIDDFMAEGSYETSGPVLSGSKYTTTYTAKAGE